MGLDVYLRHCSDWETELGKEKKDQEQSDAHWDSMGDYTSLTDEQKKEARDKEKERRKEHGLDEWGSSTLIQNIELDSAVDPTHLFKVGYLRSSYNSAGIQSVLARRGIPGLDYIFHAYNEYLFTPDWGDALHKVNEVLGQYEEWFKDKYSQFDVMEVSGIDGVRSPEQALEVFKKEYERVANGDGSYNSFTCRAGTFYMKGIEVYGLLKSDTYTQGMFVVYKRPGSNTIEEDWYYKALLITRETIIYVLSQPIEEQGNYRLAWSG